MADSDEDKQEPRPDWKTKIAKIVAEMTPEDWDRFMAQDKQEPRPDWKIKVAEIVKAMTPEDWDRFMAQDKRSRREDLKEWLGEFAFVYSPTLFALAFAIYLVVFRFPVILPSLSVPSDIIDGLTVLAAYAIIARIANALLGRSESRELIAKLDELIEEIRKDREKRKDS